MAAPDAASQPPGGVLSSFATGITSAAGYLQTKARETPQVRTLSISEDLIIVQKIGCALKRGVTVELIYQILKRYAEKQQRPTGD